jgi:hypothetical protein
MKASGINPRFKIEELSVTLVLDLNRLVTVFFATLDSATQSETEA